MDAQKTHQSAPARQDPAHDLFGAIDAQDQARVQDALRAGACPKSAIRGDSGPPHSDPDQVHRPHSNDTPLTAALRFPEPHLPILALLLDSGARVEAEHLLCSAKKSSWDAFVLLGRHVPNETALRMDGQALRKIFFNRAASPKALETAVRFGLDPNAKNENGATLLMIAAHNGLHESVEFLARHGADLDACGADGRSALLLALLAWPHNPDGALQCAKILVERGCDVHVATPAGETPLMIAVRQPHLELVKLLARAGADANARTSLFGVSLAMFAANVGSLECLRVLADLGADLDAKDREGKTCLEWAGSNADCAAFIQSHRERHAIDSASIDPGPPRPPRLRM